MDDYYPFGLRFNSYSRENTIPQNYKFNGKEEQKALDLGWLDYGPRMYMPDIGRWGVIDLLAAKFPSWSPYNFSFNNPVRFIDPDGRAPEDNTDKPKKQQRQEYREAKRELKGLIRNTRNSVNAAAFKTEIKSQLAGLKNAYKRGESPKQFLKSAYNTPGNDAIFKNVDDKTGSTATGLPNVLSSSQVTTERKTSSVSFNTATETRTGDFITPPVPTPAHMTEVAVQGDAYNIRDNVSVINASDNNVITGTGGMVQDVFSTPFGQLNGATAVKVQSVSEDPIGTAVTFDLIFGGQVPVNGTTGIKQLH
jgi:RHS repeat-associated protein